MWAARCMHEAQLHESNSYITLTYAPEHLPPTGSLVPSDMQKFFKRLRKKHKIRYFYCGEYGDIGGRPHYHAIIFGYDFPDKVLFKTRDEIKYYVSDELAKLWIYGTHLIGEVTFESAAYVARYCLKKVTGDEAFDHYNDINYHTGEIYNTYLPEYSRMSTKPGIGRDWFFKYHTDCFPSDFLIVDDKKIKIPRYYQKILNNYDSTLLEQIKAKRVIKAKKHAENNSPARLQVRKRVHELKAKQLVRTLE